MPACSTRTGPAVRVLHALVPPVRFPQNLGTSQQSWHISAPLSTSQQSSHISAQLSTPQLASMTCAEHTSCAAGAAAASQYPQSCPFFGTAIGAGCRSHGRPPRLPALQCTSQALEGKGDSGQTAGPTRLLEASTDTQRCGVLAFRFDPSATCTGR